LRHHYPACVERRAELLVIAPDSGTRLREYWEREQLPFPGLADPDHAVATVYRQGWSWRKFGRQPAAALVDCQGCLRFTQYGDSWRDTLPIPDMLDLLDALRQEEKVRRPV